MIRFQVHTFGLLFVLFLSTQIDGNQTKRMFALCPPHFFPIPPHFNQCYFISSNRVNWLDAHFECKDRKSRLAEPLRKEDRFLRKYLNHLNDSRPGETWIGARFNWEQNKWQWGYEGKDLTYQSFSQMSAENRDLKFHCAILKPNLKYRWSASSCVEQHQFVCQHGIRYANERNRHEIYKKWNETYPNEKAIEFEHVVSKDDLLRWRRSKSRSHPNVRHLKNEQKHRQRNEIDVNLSPQPHELQNLHKKNRKNSNRLRNRGFGKQFELNRIRAGGIRQPINFNRTKFSNNRPWPRMRKLTTTTTILPITLSTIPSTKMTTTTMTMAPTTAATFKPKIWSLNDVNRYDEVHGKYSPQIKENKNERFMKEQQDQQANILKDNEQMSNIFNLTEKNSQAELFKQREEKANNQHAIQTNEILDNVATTTMSPNEEKKLKVKKMKERLKSLSVQEQNEFFKRRAERKRKVRAGSKMDSSRQ